MIDRYRLWRHRRRHKKAYNNAVEYLNVQVYYLDPKDSGLVIFTYGTPDYMVSGSYAKRLKKEIEPLLKEKYPNHTFLFLPFFVSLEEEKTEETE